MSELDNVTVFKLPQPRNAPISIVLIPLPIITFFKFKQLENADGPIDSTLPGISIDFI